MINTTNASGQISGRHIIRAVLIAIIFAVIGTFILIYQILPSNEINLKLGQVAPQNITAPEQIIYTSDLETRQARERARNSISTIYTRPNPQVAREQVDRLRKIFEYMETVRADPYASLSEKCKWIDAIPDLTLQDTVID